MVVASRPSARGLARGVDVAGARTSPAAARDGDATAARVNAGSSPPASLPPHDALSAAAHTAPATARPHIVRPTAPLPLARRRQDRNDLAVLGAFWRPNLSRELSSWR